MTTCARPECGKELPRRRTVYCSNKCCELEKSKRYRATHPRIAPPVKCQRPECQNTYQAVGGRRYCSDECAEIMRKLYQHERDKNRPDRGKSKKSAPAPKPKKAPPKLAGTPDRSPDAVRQAQRQVAKIGTIRRWDLREPEPLIDFEKSYMRERIRPRRSDV